MHVVITGASSGIGRALALEYGRAGAALTLVARREELLRELETIGGFLDGAIAKNGAIDVFVNNAGVMDIGPTHELSAEIGQRMLDVCLSAPLRLTRAVLPAMLARRSGTIVQVASVAAFVPPPGGTWYGAAKAGLSAFSETLRVELKGTGVNVLSVYPGPVKTPLADGARATYSESAVIDSMPEGTPEVLAQQVLRSVDKRSARLVYPKAYAATRWFPSFFRWMTALATPGFREQASLHAPVQPASLPPVRKTLDQRPHHRPQAERTAERVGVAP